jgi:hypothetical protein
MSARPPERHIGDALIIHRSIDPRLARLFEERGFKVSTLEELNPLLGVIAASKVI